ncbi:DUF624 domain-containing protein [Lederbergia sp. NSJ-179]|uniref:YesL family protein n=1 Tax=Lederbergia sp. NSJ-179 TaxID=2931402 RepID=UPI001FD557E1|nr:DUF624 domain-containing protein [Lederbergia sp. NSJ-179]MCJ7843191.1 DUF624 domain-containing protein [Lederbergia sp. NSJ-179]
MKGGSILKSIEYLNHILIRILNLVYVNFLWVFFTLIGLGVFGIGPSTYALVSVCRQWILGKRPPVFQTFWKYYKESFKESIIVSFVYAIIGFVLVVDLMHVVNWYIRVALIIVCFIYLLSLTYIYPIMAQYDWKGIFFKIRMSFLFGFAHLQYSLVLFLFIGLSYWILTRFLPGVLPFFGISFLFFTITWMANQVFKRMEMKEQFNSDQIIKENQDEKNASFEVS